MFDATYFACSVPFGQDHRGAIIAAALGDH
jgi:hypothetical protein